MLSYQQRKKQLKNISSRKQQQSHSCAASNHASSCREDAVCQLCRQAIPEDEPLQSTSSSSTHARQGARHRKKHDAISVDMRTVLIASLLVGVCMAYFLLLLVSGPLPVSLPRWIAAGFESSSSSLHKMSYTHRKKIFPRPGGVVLSWSPRIMLFEDVLTPAECDALMQRASGRLESVGTFSGAVDAKIRTSQSMWFSSPQDANDELVRRIRARLLDMVLVPSTHAEDLQVTRYMPGDKYDLHYDFSQPDRTDRAKFPYGDVERAATVLVYLTDAFQGGETVFPRVATPGSKGRNLLQNVPRVDDQVWPKVGNLSEFCGPESRSDALRARPARRGGAVVFFGYTPEGVRDMDTVHGSCPVRSGVKMVAQQWIQLNVLYASKNAIESVVNEVVMAEESVAEDTDLADTDLADTDLADTDLADTDLADTDLADTDLAEEQVDTQGETKIAAKEAIATLVTTREYALGAVVLGKTLRATNTSRLRDMVALVAPHGAEETRLDSKAVQWMEEGGWIVQRVARLSHVAGSTRSFLRADLASVSFSKIHLWNLTQYERVLFIDADAMVLGSIDFLFGPSYWKHSSSYMVDFWINGVPETNGQVKTGLFGLRPSEEVFSRLVDGLQRDDVEFTNNEQGYISKVLEQEWMLVPEEQRMPYQMHLCSGACALTDKKFGGAWRDQVQSGLVVDFQGLSKPWQWPQHITHAKCRVMHVFALLWQVLAMSPTQGHTMDTLRNFQKMRERHDLIAEQDKVMQSALHPWLMRITEKLGAMNARGGKARNRAMRILCESGLMDMELPLLGLVDVFKQLCSLFAHGKGGIGNM